jgi:hypothetical protein
MKKKNIVKIVLVFSLLLSFISVQYVWPQNTGYQDPPIQLGTSGGNINDISRRYCCTGTLGALVEDGNGVQYILSNNHVLARTNQGRVGEDIIQPGLADQGCVNVYDAVADLSWFVPISFKKGLNVVDAAIAQIRTGMVNTSGLILDIGEVSKQIVSPTLALGMRVKKSGRTTGLTSGTVLATNVTITVGYNKTCGMGSQIAKFNNQIRIGPAYDDVFSAGGDSGSLIVENCSTSPRAVGLLFAGSSTDTFANPITNVLPSLSVSMVGTDAYCTTSTTSGGITGSLAMTAQSQLSPHANPRAVEAVNRVKEHHEEAILNLEGVVGIGVGLSETMPEDVVIEVYVKKPAHEMKHVIPEMLEDVPVKIVETGEIVAF